MGTIIAGSLLVLIGLAVAGAGLLRQSWILSTCGVMLAALGFAVLFLTFDGAIKLIPNQMVADASRQLGYQPDSMPAIGVVLLVCLITYLVPRTSVLGAVLLTGYLGGAIATHVRIGNPLFTHILFPTYVAALIWGGLLLRKPALRRLVVGG